MEIIGSYHDYQPTILYSERVFEHLNDGQTFYTGMHKPLWNILWGKGVPSEEAFLQLQSWALEKQYAILYKDLFTLPMTALFQHSAPRTQLKF